MNKIGLTVIFVFALGASVAGAEFYKYVDENGTVRYTDDASQIPGAQIDHALRYPEANPLSSSPVATDSGPRAPDPVDKSEGVAGIEPAEKDSAPGIEKEPPADLDHWRQQLEQQKKSLDESYRTLTAELKVFEAEKIEAKTKSRIRAYNVRAIELNRQIEAYEKRRQDLNRQVEAYNKAAKGPGKATE